jgi:hypothetical protein
MTKFTARTIGTQDTKPLSLKANTLDAARVEAETLLGDMFIGDELAVEYENQNGMPVIAASKIIGKKTWTNTQGADYVQ